MCKLGAGTGNGFICPRCGSFVIYGAMHNCVLHYPLPQLPLKNYKCPDCKGEFSDPAGFYSSYKCPFCGKRLKGLNNE